MEAPVLSDAVNSLDALHKRRYVEKLQFIHSPDPYLMPKSMFFDPLASPSLPDICYPDIYNYLVHTKSAYSHESLKNFKSLEAYKCYVAGWVKQVLVHENSAGILCLEDLCVSQAHCLEHQESSFVKGEEEESPYIKEEESIHNKGEPAYEMMETDTDWTPSLHLGHTSVTPTNTARSARRT
ncbi:uncharacterized protein LOC130928038 isoform X4 [Corythoichthys intestinalis]|uniref:uncharacterized protein LOC130928038 isoform X4 n=1 Tax=Corythoichthys intestinalis TaxID=161448 RepID=UPI0025A59EBE|nr:uncharacterized protein LOC130928038 isoform X4 [Corythoichthys intestinalis]